MIFYHLTFGLFTFVADFFNTILFYMPGGQYDQPILYLELFTLSEISSTAVCPVTA